MKQQQRAHRWSSTGEGEGLEVESKHLAEEYFQNNLDDVKDHQRGFFYPGV